MVNRESPQCHICTSATIFYARKDSFELYECTQCHLVFVFPEPTENTLKYIYSGEAGYQANKIKDISKIPVSKSFQKILSYCTDKLFEDTRNRVVCDIGASNGEFLYAARSQGFKVCGVEMNESTAHIAQSFNLNVEIGKLSDYIDSKLQRESVDIVHLGDVIEHVPSPRNLLNEVSYILKKHGYVILSTPNLNCAWGKYTRLLYTVFGIPMSTCTPPHHIFQFNNKNLNNLAHSIGFSTVATWYNGRPSLRYELGSLHMLKRIREEKRLDKKVFFMLYTLCAYSMYTIGYIFIEILKYMHIITQDFSMTVVLKKQ